MKRVTFSFFLGALLALSLSVQSIGQPTWPALTTVNWNSRSNVPCFQGLIYCLLDRGVSYQTFLNYVQSRGHSIFWWSSDSWAAYVQIPQNQNLAAEALIYKNYAYSRYAGPVMTSGSHCWPSDKLYADENIRKQWYLTRDFKIGGIEENVDINLTPVFDDLEQHGIAGVNMGVIDTGLPYANGSLTHPDLDDANRFKWEQAWGIADDPELSHGTGITGILAAESNNGPNSDWGMTGVNTVGKVWMYRQISSPNDSIVITWDIESLKHLVRHHQPDSLNPIQVVNYSQGYTENESDPSELELWKIAFEDLEDEGCEMPLFVCAAGNGYPGDNLVNYPARFAYPTDVNGYHEGYPFIMCISGMDENGDSHYSSDDDYLHVNVVAPAYVPDIFFEDPPNPMSFHLGLITCQVPSNFNNDDIPPPGYDLGVWRIPDEYRASIGPPPKLAYFRYNSGTSEAAPLVTGTASLILSEALENDEGAEWGGDWNAWRLRRILEKTAVDFNDDPEEPKWDDPLEGCDDEMGYGLIDAYAAVTNRDLYQWQLPSGWSFISSPIDPVYNPVTRVTEELTLDNADYNNRLNIMEGWDVAEQDYIDYLPGTYGGGPLNDIGDWDTYSAYYIHLASADSLLICGQRIPVDTPILLHDDQSPNISSWSYVAYYPDYEESARYELTDIATWGQVSDLLICRDVDGYFYLPHMSFNQVTMRPGEGYEMQMHGNRDVYLTYALNDPNPVPRRPHNGDEFTNEAAHFKFKKRTGDFLPILITNVRLNNRQCAEDDEIGVFVADTLCVGAARWNDGKIGMAAWKDDRWTEEMDGYKNINSLTFRYWDASAAEEIANLDLNRLASLDPNPSYITTDLEFNAPGPEKPMPDRFQLSAVYPNPFNAQATARYSLIEDYPFSLTVYDLQGRRLATLVSGMGQPGFYRIGLNARNMASGLYFLELKSGDSHAIAKFQVMR